ncbi:hypothetical protein TVAG_183410 [Trichomonas vaginalis G3]|uniref:Uncharacterized protein n=1 Tax=Trichomonas vaginalis (strain ATCC PRA-98 / G3) TaxID=412133 RepID=A2D979_TRIV3|nr:hypothetical protein TVAGG3_0771150 [Trichomonas vaginalis G3]EAY23105.1 hypothetical protein TVAG_183410 [Trichomonas vaginalis G3]KAI5513837.1 hypothetical protein TVAGG3_0771150 [Trichomonas vaginalis G3]|eukprot:XP_001584091.1 hypothetical protein [Trichomonas vaginalis G3]
MRNENKLFNIIYNIVHEKGKNYFPLFEFIKFKELGDSEMKKFMEFCSLQNPSEPIWKNICARFTKEPKESKHSISSPKSHKISVPAILPHEDLTVETPITEEPTQTPRSSRKKSSPEKEYQVGHDLLSGIFASMSTMKGKVSLSSSSKNTGFISLLLKKDNNTNF